MVTTRTPAALREDSYPQAIFKLPVAWIKEPAADSLTLTDLSSSFPGSLLKTSPLLPGYPRVPVV